MFWAFIWHHGYCNRLFISKDGRFWRSVISNQFSKSNMWRWVPFWRLLRCVAVRHSLLPVCERACLFEWTKIVLKVLLHLNSGLAPPFVANHCRLLNCCVEWGADQSLAIFDLCRIRASVCVLDEGQFFTWTRKPSHRLIRDCGAQQHSVTSAKAELTVTCLTLKICQKWHIPKPSIFSQKRRFSLSSIC